MTRFVLDCSMTMAWCFEDEAWPRADAVLAHLADGEALVPGLWPLEVANALAACERRERITTARIDELIGMLGSLPIRIDGQTARQALRASIHARLRKCHAQCCTHAKRIACPRVVLTSLPTLCR